MLRAYFNQKASIWDENVAEKDAAKLEGMARRLSVGPGSTILDVGTGTGVFIPFLLNRIGTRGRIVGLDIAEEMLKRAVAKSSDGCVDYLCADVTCIPVADEIFDGIICYSSFPHLQDKGKALTEMKRVMKVGGKLYICHTSSRAAINQIHRSIPTVRHDTIPDEHEMRLLLLESGLTDVIIADESESYFACATKA
jgi:ubiquinone/menaquinone biosynthesis C-methylase UbiE